VRHLLGISAYYHDSAAALLTDGRIVAGGVALNCVANGLIQRERIFERMWIQPAAGDAGGALGAALAVWHMAQRPSATAHGDAAYALPPLGLDKEQTKT